MQYHHRGAYLNSLGEIIQSYHDPATVYLWTLPMFHCNGWCTPWGITAIGGTHVCLREVRGDAIWAQIDEHRVTHLNGAPTVVTTIMNAPEARTLDYALVVTTAGAPPSPTTILEMERMGFRIVHVYGLTETYGPYTVCQWQDAWAGLSDTERAKLQARQGVGMIQTDAVRVVEVLDEASGATGDGAADDDPDSVELVDVPADGTTMGEIVMHGNNVMSGYYRDPEATTKAFAGGWYHSGDLGVMHPDGYVELRDRAKDVIISGGENISTVEVEQAVLSHEAVLEAAVVGVPDERWGERPKAFVVLRQGKAGRARARSSSTSRRPSRATRRRARSRSSPSSPRPPPARSRSSSCAPRSGAGRSGRSGADRAWRHGHGSVTMDAVEPMGPVMSLPTDPFAAPSSGPIVLARADDAPPPAGPRTRRRALAAATGTVALGAAVVGVTLGTVDAPDLSSAASTVAPAAGAAAAVAPPAVGAPIVPATPTPPAVTTRATPAADTTSTRSRPTRPRATTDRAAALARTARLRERAWERAVERALVARAGAARAHGHGHGHHH